MARLIRSIPQLLKRRRDAHKGDFGRVLVLAGSDLMPGAAALCAQAALRGGAGLVRVATTPRAADAVARYAPCATLVKESSLRRIDADVLAIGPGWGQTPARGRLLRRVLDTTNLPAVIDADGLNLLAQFADWPKSLLQRVRRGGAVVLTPHPGEMGRLASTAGLRFDSKRREEIADAAARASGAIIVLKGAGTIVTDGARRYVNRTGNPGMATGGSGDVLTGIIAAFIGQKLTPFDAAVLGVYVHGRAGDLAVLRVGETSLIASDLIEYLPAALRRSAVR